MKLLSKDLRTGNLLQGKPISIPRLGMYSNGITAITAHGIDMIEQGIMPDDNYEPIPLSDSFFHICGFKLTTGSKLWNKRYLQIYIPDDDKIGEHISIYFEGASIHSKIEYVHQFQNLWYILHGQELTIDTSKLK